MATNDLMKAVRKRTKLMKATTTLYYGKDREEHNLLLVKEYRKGMEKSARQGRTQWEDIGMVG